jgi:osmotically-inducible protein OsmY
MHTSTAPVTIEQRIRQALRQKSATTEVERIQIIVDDGTVTLQGVLRTPEEITLVERAAWATCGVYAVRNQLRTGYKLV